MGWDLLQSAMNNKLITNQIEISVKELGAFTNEVGISSEHGHSIMAWSPLGGGDLPAAWKTQEVLDEIAKKSGRPCAIAVTFLLAHPAKILPIIRTNNIDKISSISDATKVN